MSEHEVAVDVLLPCEVSPTDRFWSVAVRYWDVHGNQISITVDRKNERLVHKNGRYFWVERVRVEQGAPERASVKGA
ncbi:hypothetical protein KOR42_23360 [Thalassoglobus neptunius]|uniref:Uncharacterized protein n=1 Tax=Thalassoglobus neptunius TaxID=1938619 RepID=A0A5C5X8A8_9PLAN|nr:hypothetical protein [Thalassoglobus neptunius]TWT58949.1 hypothetical protein KOR42_23360 [Thalassoglobus neptunius]